MPVDDQLLRKESETTASHEEQEHPSLLEKKSSRWSNRVRNAKAAKERTEYDEDKEKLEKDGQAKDDGGPTKEFLYLVFNQLGNLELFTPERKNDDDDRYFESSREPIRLFEKTISGYVPTTDDMLKHRLGVWNIKGDNQKPYIAKIKAFFRAIGRMMAHCILLSKEDFGPIPLPSMAMPKLLRESK